MIKALLYEQNLILSTLADAEKEREKKVSATFFQEFNNTFAFCIRAACAEYDAFMDFYIFGRTIPIYIFDPPVKTVPDTKCLQAAHANE